VLDQAIKKAKEPYLGKPTRRSFSFFNSDEFNPKDNKDPTKSENLSKK